jgi:uncharacterized protein YndB with AHSA1/START domain
MANPPNVIVSRYCHAPRERVFEAWAEPGLLSAWYTPGADWTVAVEFVDFRVGGHYRVRFGPPDESVSYLEEGIYREIEPPLRLVFDTRLSASGDVLAETRCRVDLHEAHAGTEVRIAESGFDDAHREDRVAGWGRTLDNLVRHFARPR